MKLLTNRLNCIRCTSCFCRRYFCFQRPFSGNSSANHDLSVQASDAMTMYAQLLTRLSTGIRIAFTPFLSCSIRFSWSQRLFARKTISSVGVDAVQSFEARAARSLQLVVRARVPLEGAETCELAAFRARDGGPEHYAILIGAKDGAGLAPPGPVLTRLHSECFTGDLLGSLRCDCGDQLRGAVRTIAAAGGGVLLYLAQEGRGIGLMNKLRAYRLQDEGFDTLVANERLGFAADERLYDIAARMLTLLGYRAVRLMTNNLDKIEALKAAGIEVSERVPHSFPDNVHSRDYLKAKAEGGHLL